MHISHWSAAALACLNPNAHGGEPFKGVVKALMNKGFGVLLEDKGHINPRFGNINANENEIVFFHYKNFKWLIKFTL